MDNLENHLSSKQIIRLESEQILEKIDELVAESISELDCYDNDFKKAILLDVNKRVSNLLLQQSVKLLK